LKLIEIDPVADKCWLNFIQNVNSTIFHHPLWLYLLKEQYGFNIKAVCLLDESNNIVTGIPFCVINGFGNKKRFISLPFSDYCSLQFVKNDYSGSFVDLLFEFISADNINSVEIRDKINSSDNKFKFSSEAVLHKLDFESTYLLTSKKFADSHIRGIKKAEKAKLKVEISDNFESVKQFYSLHLLTRKKLGVPIQPKSFFYLLYKYLLLEKLGFVVVIKKEKTPIAAAIFLGFNNTLTYKFGASHPGFLDLRPNNLLFSAAINEAINRGFKSLDFGRTDSNNEGLRRFKSGWGAYEIPLTYSYFPGIPGKGIFNFIKDKIVKPIIKYSPKFICRLIGELFYKYFT
jgi:hypothetical protein